VKNPIKIYQIIGIFFNKTVKYYFGKFKEVENHGGI